MEILKAVILLGIMGLIFGAVLAFAAQKFAVEVDEREAKILEVLPGANYCSCYTTTTWVSTATTVCSRKYFKYFGFSFINFNCEFLCSEG